MSRGVGIKAIVRRTGPVCSPRGRRQRVWSGINWQRAVSTGRAALRATYVARAS